MGSVALIVASIALNAIQTSQANKELDRQSQAQAELATAQVRETERQRLEVQRQAQEKKSDRVREADRETASIIVAMADVGGAGTLNESRFVGEVGFMEGLDLARIEGNRKNQEESLKAEGEFRRNTALNVIASNNARKKSNTIGFLSSSIKAGLAYKAGGAASKAGSGATASQFNSNTPVFSGSQVSTKGGSYSAYY